MANRAAVDEFVANRFLKDGREDMIALLQNAKIAFGRLSDLDDLVSHPQNRWITVEAGEQEIEILSPAAVVAGDKTIYGAVPELDEHGTALRQEFMPDG